MVPPTNVSSTGVASTGKANNTSGGGGGGSGGNSSSGVGVDTSSSRNGYNASGCMAWFSALVQPRCNLSNITSASSSCSLGCASTYADWFNTCVSNGGPLFPYPNQYTALSSLNNGTTLAAMSLLAYSCSQCSQSALQPLYSLCQANSTQSSVNSSYVDPLYTLQFPSLCPAQCALNYSSYLAPLYWYCVAPYGPTAIPMNVSTFFQQCAPRTAPSIVTGLVVLPLSASQVAISWNPATVVKAPSDAVQYYVERGVYNATTGQQASVGVMSVGGNSTANQTSAAPVFVQQYSFAAGNGTQALDATVSGGLAYVYGIVACNSIGCSPLSSLLAAVTPLPPPNAPTMIAVNVITPTSATVMWQQSQPVMGDNSTVYYVLSRQLLYSTQPPAGLYRGVNTTFTFNDLQPNTSYVLSVVAASVSTGQSLNATVTNFTTPFAAPSAVQSLTVSSVSLAAIRLQWSPPALIGAWAIVNYTVWLTNAGVSLTPLGTTIQPMFDTSTVLGTGLNVLTAYTFFVTATNTGGLMSAFTASVTVTTPANAPNVTNPIVPAVSPLGGMVTLAWNQSTDINNGGSPITALHLSLMSPLDSREIDLPASAQGLNVSNLNATTQYSVTWRAMNAYGWSANGPTAQFLTKSAAPSIVAFVAGDSCACRTFFGVNSTLSIQFATGVQMPNISSQAAVDALFAFIPPISGSYVGQWINNGSVAVITITGVNVSAPAYTIGLATVVVTATLFDASGKSASALGQRSPPLSGSWYGAVRTVRFFGANQTSITVQEDSSLNPIAVMAAPLAIGGSVVLSTAMLTLSVLYGSLSVAKNNSLGLFNASLTAAAVSPNSVTVNVPYSTLAALLQAKQITYTPVPLSTTTDVLMATVKDVLTSNGNPADSVNIAILISAVNHAPSIRFNTSTGLLPAWVFGSSYVLPAIVVSDVDNTTNPSASLSVVLSAQSVTALLTVSATVSAPTTVSSSVQAGGSAPSLTLTGPLADLNTYLFSMPVSINDAALPPSSTQASLQLFVNDNGNGGGAPLTYSTTAAVAVTCAGTAAPTVTSAVFAGDAGSILLTFSAPLDQSATTSTACSVFFDANTVASFGANPSCPFRGGNGMGGGLAVVLGFGATILPYQNVTFSALSAVRRCAGGAAAAGSIAVQPPATTVTPVVTISGPSIVSSCDTLTLYGQATGLGGRPATATYSWSVAAGFTADPTLATANNNVLTSGATSAVLTVSNTALYNSSTYYFFYLTVSNFLGASNTSSIVVYKSPLSLPVLQPQGSTALTVARARPFFIAVTPVLSACLVGDSRTMNFSWSVSPALSSMPPSNNPQLNVPGFTLSAGSTYTFTLTGVMAADATLASSTVVTVSVPASPITVSITGGSVQQSSQLLPLYLSATAVDPDASSIYGSWSFAWTCLSSAGVACQDNRQGIVLATTGAASLASSSSLVVDAGKLAPDVYTWSVMATSGSRTASSTVSVSIVANPIPIVTITSFLTIVNPNGLLYYAASAYDVTNTPLSYSWSQVSGPTLSLTTVAVSLRTPTLVLNNQGASVFVSGAVYAFQCVVTNGYNQSSFAQVAVTINAPPFGGSMSVSPSSGYAFNTAFALSAEGWQSSTGAALAYQFFAVAADHSLSQLNVRSGASVLNTQLAQGLTSNVTVVAVITDALGATTTFSALVAVQPPPGLASDTAGSVFNSILTSAATSASQTSNVGQLFGTLNALQDSIYLALLDAESDSPSRRRLLGFTATSVPSYVTALNSAAQSLVAADGAQADPTTLANTAIKQTSQTVVTTAATVLSSGQTILATLVAASQALTLSTDQAKATAQAASTNIIQLAGQQLAVILLASAEANITTESAQTATTFLLANISAQCDSLSISSLDVAGQRLAVNASSAVYVYAGSDAITDSPVYALTAIDNTTVTFPANPALVDSADIDSRVLYMPTDPYVWAVSSMTAISPVVYASRVSSSGEPLSAVDPSTVTMVISVPVDALSCPVATCEVLCAVWDDSQSLWNSSSALVATRSMYLTATGQSFVDCSVYSAMAASAAVMAVNSTGSTMSDSSSSSSAGVPALSSSSAVSWYSLSSSSAAVRLSSSSSYMSLASSSSAASTGSSMVTSSRVLLYPAGSLEIAFYMTVSSGVNVSSAGFIANLTTELASNLASFYNLSAAQLLPYVRVLSVTSTASTSRRLLQAGGTANVNFVLYSTVSELGGDVNVTGAVSQFQAAAAAGTLLRAVRLGDPIADCLGGRRQRRGKRVLLVERPGRSAAAVQQPIVPHSAGAGTGPGSGHSAAGARRGAHLLLRRQGRQRACRQRHAAPAAACWLGVAVKITQSSQGRRSEEWCDDTSCTFRTMAESEAQKDSCGCCWPNRKLRDPMCCKAIE